MHSTYWTLDLALGRSDPRICGSAPRDGRYHDMSNIPYIRIIAYIRIWALYMGLYVPHVPLYTYIYVYGGYEDIG